MENRFEAGMKVFQEMLPESVAKDTSSDNVKHFAPELGKLSIENVFGTLWTRQGLDRRSRSLVTLGILIALKASDELAYHFPIALKNGITAEELEEVIYHSTAYAGFPAASEASHVADRVLNRK